MLMKYKLNLTIAHQYVDQMSEKVKEAVFGNVGTMVVFRVGSADAEIFEKEFAPFFLLEDVVSLGQRQIYLRLMIDGVGSQPFSATTLPPIPPPEISYKQNVIDFSRMTFARKKEDVEKEIREWHAPVTFSQEDRARDFQKGEQGKMSKSIGEPRGFQSQATYFPKKEQGSSQTGGQGGQSDKPPYSEPQKFSGNAHHAPKLSGNALNTSLRDALQKEIKRDTGSTLPREQKKSEPQKQSQSHASAGRVSLSSLLGSQKQSQTHVVDAKQKADLKTTLSQVTQGVIQTQQPSTPKPQQKEDIAHKSGGDMSAKNSAEIPPDVLKKLLE